MMKVLLSKQIKIMLTQAKGRIDQFRLLFVEFYSCDCLLSNLRSS